MKVKVTQLSKELAEKINNDNRIPGIMEYHYMSNQHSNVEDYCCEGELMYHDLTKDTSRVCCYDKLSDEAKSSPTKLTVARKVSFDYKGNFNDIIDIHPDHVSNIILKDIEKGLIVEVLD